MTRLRSVALVLAGLALAGCGDSTTPTPAPASPAGGETPAAAAPTPGATRENPVIEALALNDWYRAILVDRASIANPRDLETIARSYCEGLTVCRAAIWFEEGSLPRAMPVSATAVAAQAYAFGRTAAGVENTLWNCDLFPQFEAERACLPRRLRG